MRSRFLTAALALLLGAGMFVSAPTHQASAWYGNTHCVRHGETLSGIAASYGTTAWAIAYANGISNPNYVRAGACLTIPSGGYAKPAYGGYQQPSYGGYQKPAYGGYDYGYKPYYGGYDYNYGFKPYYGGYNYGYKPYYGNYNYGYGKKW